MKKIMCKCGCGTELPEGTGCYNIPLVGYVCIECYSKIVPKKQQGTYSAPYYIQKHLGIK